MRAILVVVGALLVAGCGRHDANRVPDPDVKDSIVVTSPAFTDGRPIPERYTCHSAGQSPEVDWRGVPADAKSVALVVSDPDAPKRTFIHWVLYDLPATDGRVPAGSPPTGAREADNGAGKKGWYPPCPPSGTHHYRFTVYALDGRVTKQSTSDVLAEIDERAVARGTLTGTVQAG